MTNQQWRGRYRSAIRRNRLKPGSGLTLIEVVASLLLCGLLFSFVIAGFNQQRRQFRHAALVQRAIDQTDLLVASWYMQAEAGPRAGAGRFDGPERMTWRVETVETERELLQLGILKYRLEVQSAGVVLVTLELLGRAGRQAPVNEVR